MTERPERPEREDAAEAVTETASAATGAVTAAQSAASDPVSAATGLASSAAGVAAAAGAEQAQQVQQAMDAAGQAASAAQQVQQDPVGGLLRLAGAAGGLAGAAAGSQAVGQVASAATQAAGAARTLAQSAPASTSSAASSGAGGSSAAASDARADSPSAHDVQTAWTLATADALHVHYRLTSDGDGGADWSVRRFALRERLDEPYECVVDITCDDASADSLTFLGKNATIEIERGGQLRSVIGVVRRVARGSSGISDRQAVATLTIVPALWTLSQTRQSRIFQDKTVPEILQEVLSAGLEPLGREVRLELQATYVAREYCVQWEESNLDFVQRLMEEEGIFYFFEFADEREVMVLGDKASSFSELVTQDGNAVPYTPISQGSGPIESVLELTSARQITPNKAVVREYDWTRAATELEGRATLQAERGDVGDLEEYVHGPVVHFGEYSEPAFGAEDIAKQADLVMRRRGTQVEIATGRTELTTLLPGMVFELSGHPDPDLDQHWLVVGIRHEGTNAGEDTGRAEEEYINHIEAIPTTTDYRPRRTRFKRRVESVMTATVVGPSGEEIHTDVHGRVKVQFHWDRLGKRNERSSCFLRSMQPWAGESWGFVFLPRVGMEVVVSFVDGDIDRPLVIGSVYKATHPPPLDLPDERTKSIIKTSSSPGGDGYNELSFEDAAGNEKIVIHAQKDMNETIENDHSTSVGGNQTNSVGGDRSHSVDKNESITITGSQKVTISGAEKGDGQEIQGAQLDITGKYKLDASDEILVQAPNKITFTVGGSTIVMEPDKITMTSGGRSSLVLDENACVVSSQGTQMLLDANACVQSSGASQMLLDENAAVQSSGGSRVVLDANASVAASGGGQVILDANATVKGTNAKLEGTGQATVTAPTSTLAGAAGRVEAAAAGVTATGPKVDVTGSGPVNISGAVVKIN